ncbi:hypothetical protein ACUOFC_58595, partial [Escherichia sp. TWPC-MK]
RRKTGILFRGKRKVTRLFWINLNGEERVMGDFYAYDEPSSPFKLIQTGPSHVSIFHQPLSLFSTTPTF